MERKLKEIEDKCKSLGSQYESIGMDIEKVLADIPNMISSAPEKERKMLEPYIERFKRVKQNGDKDEVNQFINDLKSMIHVS